MKILVACEESQAVTIELRRLGHEAYSCDIEPCSGGHPEWHLQQDVLPLLREKWDMILAFPPCTHLCVSGAPWFEEKRKDGRQQQGIDFFMKFANCDCEKVAIENPVGIMSTTWRKPDQIINPWEFGHAEQKKTCLWLKGLPKLIATENVYEYMMTLPLSKRTRIHYLGSGHSVERSKTFPRIARAMAEQWAGDANEHTERD